MTGCFEVLKDYEEVIHHVNSRIGDFKHQGILGVKS